MTVADVTAAPDRSAEVCRSEDGTFLVFSGGACIASDVHDRTADGTDTEQVWWWRACRVVQTPDDPWEIGHVEAIEIPHVEGGGGSYWAGPTETEALKAALAAAPRKG